MKRQILIAAFVLASLAQAYAQDDGKPITSPLSPYVSGGRIVTIPFKSKLMNGKLLPYRVVLPAGYWDKDATGRVFEVVYLLHGLTGHFENWTEKTGVASSSFGHDIIIVTPEGNDSWYTDSATVPSEKYESYMVQELIPEIDKRFRTIPERRGRTIAGLSMGGYGAIKFGLKYPDKFKLVGSFSGALGAASFTEKNAGTIGKNIDAIFGAENSETRRTNDVFAMIRGLSAEKIKLLPFIYQSCGTEDFLFQNNRDFAALLNEKKVPHEYRELPGGHTWTFWADQVQEFLRVRR